MRISKWIPVLVTMALSAALAQGPVGQGGPPDPAGMIRNRVGYLAGQIGLTPAQQTGVTAIFTNSFHAGQSVRSSLDANRQSLAAAIKANDAPGIDRLAATAGYLTGQLVAIDSKGEAAFYATLSGEQKGRYDALPQGPGPGGSGGASRPTGGYGPPRPPRPPQPPQPPQPQQ